MLNEPKVIGIADLHLSSHKPYYKKAFRKFMDWFKAQDFGPRELNVIVLAGDLHNSVNICTTEAAMFDEFTDECFKKAKEVWCNLGNHDFGLVGYNKDDVCEYLNKHNIKWVAAPQVLELGNGMSCLFLPHNAKYAMDINLLNETIKELNANSRANCCVTHYELHPHFTDNYVNTDYAQEFVIGGHIHNRGEGLEYCGSILPCSKDDDKFRAPSVIKVIYKDRAEQIKIPPFVKFDFINCDNFGSIDALQTYIQNAASGSNVVYQAVVQYTKKSSALLKALKGVDRSWIYQVEKLSEEKKEVNIDIKKLDAIFSKPKILEAYFLANPNRKLLMYCYNKIKEKA